VKGFFQLISSTDFLHLFKKFHPVNTEILPLEAALGRILACEINSPELLPPFSRSTMDGFAVRARDTFGCSESEPALLDIVGEIAMGVSGHSISLKPGQTCRIWTGGELAVKADAIVMVEYSHLLDDHTVEIFKPIAPGENVIQAGDDTRPGQQILAMGRKLRPQDLGVLAGLGITEVSVYRRPVVTIISTGDELVPPDQTPGSGQIRDINSTTLAALVEESGGIARKTGIIPDDFTAMLATCKQAVASSDMVLLSGGSSVGKRDFTLKVLEQLEQAELLAHGVAIRPGKPTILARINNKAVFGLPGHVASAMVVFYLFVRPLLLQLSGKTGTRQLLSVEATTAEQIPSAIGREEYVRVRLQWSNPDKPPTAIPMYGKSGLLSPLVKADGLMVIDRDSEGMDLGQPGKVLLFPSLQ
jgi:molybdopterin molybdotransferase